jgi:protease I
MSDSLRGLNVAILVDNGFEESEMVEPRRALDEAGAKTTLISPQRGKVRSWQHKDWGKDFPVDVQLSDAEPGDYGALLLPGGVMNPDKLRTQPEAVEFVRSFFTGDKPVAAICHGPWMVIEAGVASGRRIASWPSLKTDIKNAGGEWVDEEAVVDGKLVSARKPEDIPAFNRSMMDAFGASRAKLESVA